jgi:hypothetical protein
MKPLPPDELQLRFIRDLNQRIEEHRHGRFTLRLDYVQAWDLLVLLQGAISHLEADTSRHNNGWAIHKALFEMLHPTEAMEEALKRGIAA